MKSEVCSVTPPGWKIRSVEEICQRVTSGGTPSRGEPAYYVDGRWPWVKTQELQDEWIDDTEEHITEEAVATSSAKELPRNTVLLAMYGATVGQLGLLRRPMTCNQACCAMIVDEETADFRYLFYQLLYARPQLKSLATGAAQQNLSGVLIKSLRFPFPHIDEQRAIAPILGTLDDEIELNRRMNETLEAMARAIFKSWFVDTTTSGLPKRWKEGTVGEDFEITMGQSPPGETYNGIDEGLPFFQGRADFGFRFPALRVYCTAPTRIANPGDTLVCVRAPVGDVNMAVQQCCVGRGLAAVRHKTGSRSYTYYAMQALREDFDCFEAEGTVFGSMGKKDFHTISHVVPPEKKVKDFETLVNPIDQMIENNENESRTLAAIRDALLPKLLSGEIRVGVN